MKIGLPPSNFKSIVESAMLFNKAPLIDPVTIKFSDKGLSVEDYYLDLICVIIDYDPEYFTKFEVDKPEDVTINKTVIERLKEGFKEDVMLISSEKNYLLLRTTRDSDNLELQYREPKTEHYPLVKLEHGYIPEKIEKDDYICLLLDTKELNFPLSELYKFRFVNGVFEVFVKSMGKFSRKPVVDFVLKDGTIDYTVDGEFLNSIVSNMSGKIMLTLHPNITVFSEIGKQYRKVYVLSNKEDRGG